MLKRAGCHTEASVSDGTTRYQDSTPRFARASCWRTKSCSQLPNICVSRRYVQSVQSISYCVLFCSILFTWVSQFHLLSDATWKKKCVHNRNGYIQFYEQFLGGRNGPDHLLYRREEKVSSSISTIESTAHSRKTFLTKQKRHSQWEAKCFCDSHKAYGRNGLIHLLYRREEKLPYFISTISRDTKGGQVLRKRGVGAEKSKNGNGLAFDDKALNFQDSRVSRAADVHLWRWLRLIALFWISRTKVVQRALSTDCSVLHVGSDAIMGALTWLIVVNYTSL